MDCAIEECRRRDPKGLYAKADAGLITNLTGVSSPYVPPTRPDLVVASQHESVTTAVARVTDLLRRRRILL